MAKTRFVGLLEAKIEAHMQDRVLWIAGGSAGDYPQYRQAVGYVAGLRDALKLCEEIEREME